MEKLKHFFKMGKHRGTISTRILTESARQRIVWTPKKIPHLPHFQTLYRQSFNTKRIHGALILFQVCRQCLTRHLESTLQDKDKKVINSNIYYIVTNFYGHPRLDSFLARHFYSIQERDVSPRQGRKTCEKKNKRRNEQAEQPAT